MCCSFDFLSEMKEDWKLSTKSRVIVSRIPTLYELCQIQTPRSFLKRLDDSSLAVLSFDCHMLCVLVHCRSLSFEVPCSL